jgi:putative phosphoesterase
MSVLGVLSDTHGLLRSEVHAHFAGVDRIIHAGDLEGPETLRRLATIAEVTAVRGNCDRGTWARALPECELLVVEGHSICVVHALEFLSLDPKAAGVSAVVFGHTHLPHNELRDGVLYFNPGSAGPARYGKPSTIGKLYLDQGVVRGEIITLTHTVDRP